ncbi:hypothetical protein VTN77DRAFT_6282 [Rasamsonia byssochlamydoides]|uniref:uncharacterized protein n=1 Tax=Rasamsonia byssochlamydoides TaxID=89139 RepID=UPI003743E622
MAAPFEDLDPTGPSPEDRVNAMRGYKATLNNPRVSEEAKKNAKDVLDNQLGGDEPRHDLYAMRNPSKEPSRVQGGLKAATKNPRVSEDAKESAQEKLAQLSNAMYEESQRPVEE